MPKDIQRLVNEQIGKSQALMRAAMKESQTGQPPLVSNTIITISRQLGSCGRQVAGRLCERLGWSVWDRDLVEAIARDAEVSNRVVEAFDEHIVSEIDRLARSLTGQYDAAGFIYEHHLARVVLSIAQHGYAIILGRGAGFLLPNALNIRLIAKENFRIENVMEQYKINREAAKERIHQSDRERAEFIHRIFGKNVDDPLSYDLMITMDSFGIDGATEVILAAQNNKKR